MVLYDIVNTTCDKIILSNYAEAPDGRCRVLFALSCKVPAVSCFSIGQRDRQIRLPSGGSNVAYCTCIEERGGSMLTPKQEMFVQNMVKGMSQADAYRASYACKNMSDKTIHEAASRLANDSKISARLSELRQQLTKETIMSAQERLEWLTGVIKGEEDINAKLKALDIMNKMQGEYVQKVEANVSSEVNINIELVDDE